MSLRIDTSRLATGSSATIMSGCEHDGAGDADALPLPAGELVRVAVQVVARRPQAGVLERLDDPFFLLMLAR